MKKAPQYEVRDVHVSTILAWIRSKEVVIPEIQRPFVWDKPKVRDLMDSLYRGFPVGYLIDWKNPNTRTKDGKLSEGRKILIDGQQRVTALAAAVLGHEVVNEKYRKERIKIAFHPIEEQFQVLNPAIQKDSYWIPDISPIVGDELDIFQLVEEYRKNNPSADAKIVQDSIVKLSQITNMTIGLIELGQDLDIETVSVIFERVNSAGMRLNQADFAMSKIAAHGTVGSNLRKLIEYFCHLAVTPEFYSEFPDIDEDFARTGFLQKISWLKNKNDDLYDPEHVDLLRVAFTSEFGRGKIGDLVSLLSGRNFATRKFEAEVQDDTFSRLEASILRFVNEN